jgi:hypothetical protein
MTQKWNLQDIRPTEPRRQRPNRPSLTISNDRPATNNPTPKERVVSESDIDMAAERVEIHDGNKDRKRSFLMVTSVVVGLVVLVIGLSAFLSKTTLTVYPEYYEPVVNAEFTAYPEKKGESLAYEVITIEATGERQVSATGEEYVETKAEGFIEITKSTAGSEQLVKNTRFRTPGGQVFRIQEPVVVPGALKNASGTLVPGSIRAKVVADAVGEEFNIPAGTKFDVPGFKESNLNELYNSISATNNEAISGGYKGQKFMINDADLSTKRQELQLELRDKLLAQVKTEKPAGFVAFDTAVAITYTALPPVSHGQNLVTIREEAVLQLPLFKEEDFAAFVAKETTATYDREPVRIIDTGVLTFSYVDSNTSSNNIANLTELKFKISGKPTIVAEFDAEKLQNDLAGKAKTSISAVLTAHPGIKSARVESKPFWRRSFPEDPTDIVIVEVVGEEK